MCIRDREPNISKIYHHYSERAQNDTGESLNKNLSLSDVQHILLVLFHQETRARESQTLLSVETLHQCHIDITCISSITSKNTKGLVWFSQVI